MSLRTLSVTFVVWALASCGSSEPGASSPTGETETSGNATPQPSPSQPDPSTSAQTEPSVAPGTCASVGGQCAGVGDCSPDRGHLVLDVRCPGHPSVACCMMPATSCGGPEDFQCTDGSATYRPGCRNGHLECPPNTRRADSGGGPSGPSGS